MTNTNLIIKISFMLLLVSLAQIVGSSNAYAFCRSDSDCSPSRLFGQQFCQNNDLYQYYVTYTCNNSGSSFSTCVALKTPQLIKTCNQKCEQGLWYIGCST